MNPQSYVQTRCARCGAAAWGHMTQAVPCGSCGQLIQPVAAPAAMPPYNAAPAPAPAPMPQAGPPMPAGGLMQGAQPMAQGTGAPLSASQPAPQNQGQVKVGIPIGVGGIKIPIKFGTGSGGISRFKIIAVAILAPIIAIAAFIVKGKFKGSGDGTAKGNLSYKDLGIDPKKGDPDKMMVAVAGAAKKWKGDAAWWDVNFQAVHADGTVDTSNGGNEVTYISIGDVQSDNPTTRKDSIKKFEFGPSGVDYSTQWGADEKWEDVVPLPQPTCGMKGLVAVLAKGGLTGDKVAHIALSPDDGPAWHVLADDPALSAINNTWWSIQDCSQMKPE